MNQDSGKPSSSRDSTSDTTGSRNCSARAAWASSFEPFARPTAQVVALKVMRFELIEDPVFGRRFEQEARAAAEVSEPHLVPVLEAGQADGRRYLASKYIAGRDARRHARRRARSSSPTPRGTRRTSARAQRAPRGRDRPPRPQAVEHHRRRRRNGDADGLRPREGPRVHGAHEARPGDGDARLPRARSWSRAARASPGDRHLRARLHDLRMRHRAGAVRDKEGIQVGLAHVAEPPPPPEVPRRPDRRRSRLRCSSALAKDPDDRPPTAAEYGRLLAEAVPPSLLIRAPRLGRARPTTWPGRRPVRRSEMREVRLGDGARRDEHDARLRRRSSPDTGSPGCSGAAAWASSTRPSTSCSSARRR